MQALFDIVSPDALVLAIFVTVLAGFVKGAVGFAMPMIMISGLSSFLPAETALAALIIPTVLANVWQALRDGARAAVLSTLKYWRYTGIVLIFIMMSAQLVSSLPQWSLYLILGGPVTLFAVLQLAGWQLHFRSEHKVRAETLIAAFAGFIGGMSGVWGPPTVAYLTALNTPKQEQMRVQGVIYGAGAVVLLLAHVQSGVLNAQSTPLSLAMVVPSLIGVAIGFRVQGQLDQVKFRKATLAVLVVAGLNLMRKGLMG